MADANIILVGFMGTGKSTVGRMLADRLDMPFVDMDETIAEREGHSIPEIFAAHGEPYFREIEARLVRELTGRGGVVVAAGGGAILDRKNMEMFDRSGTVVCLAAGREAVLARLARDEGRPLLAGDKGAKIGSLLEERAPLYAAIPRRVDASDLSTEQVVEAVLRIVAQAQCDDAPLYPLMFTPVYKDYIWGGNRIPRIYGREPGGEVCAESWEIADRPEGLSVVANGPMAGTSLRDLVVGMGPKLVGTRCDTAVFPLLVKIIDSREKLSIQVHPDNESAVLHGGEPKTEMWYVLDAEPGARLYCGVVPGTDRDAFAAAIASGNVEDVVAVLPVSPGDAIHVPGGLVHALGAGCLLLEIQQNSNTTYRVYDWGRVGADGKGRELHVEEALRVIGWEAGPAAPLTPGLLEETEGGTVWEINRCDYFQMRKIDLRGAMKRRTDGTSFHVLFPKDCAVKVSTPAGTETVARGTTCLVPAGLGEYTVSPANAGGEVLWVSL